MDFVEDLAPFFADFGQAVTVNGVAARGIFNTATDVVLGDAITQAPTLEMPASVAAAQGQTCVVGGVTYTVRQVMDQPPDGAIRLLVLARA
jgi:hypothetical protein